jgi:hypothetical protein
LLPATQHVAAVTIDHDLRGSPEQLPGRGGSATTPRRPRNGAGRGSTPRCPHSRAGGLHDATRQHTAIRLLARASLNLKCWSVHPARVTRIRVMRRGTRYRSAITGLRGLAIGGDRRIPLRVPSPCDARRAGAHVKGCEATTRQPWSIIDRPRSGSARRGPAYAARTSDRVGCRCEILDTTGRRPSPASRRPYPRPSIVAGRSAIVAAQSEVGSSALGWPRISSSAVPGRCSY